MKCRICGSIENISKSTDKKCSLCNRTTVWLYRAGLPCDIHNVLKYSYQFKKILETGGDTCHICHLKPKEKQHNLAIDHDHKTMKIRGLLCGRCNNVLGKLNDNLEILKNMIFYLDSHK